MQDFKKLKVWEKAHLLCLDIYKTTGEFPKSEVWCITSQMRRSASSVPTNIAEGCGRGTQNELKRFLQIAMGSLSELEYQIIICKDLNYIDDRYCTNSLKRIDEIRKMMHSQKVRLLIRFSLKLKKTVLTLNFKPKTF